MRLFMEQILIVFMRKGPKRYHIPNPLKLPCGHLLSHPPYSMDPKQNPYNTIFIYVCECVCECNCI